jgi:penicillin-binding protein 2
MMKSQPNKSSDPFEVKRQMDIRLEIIRFLAVAVFMALGARLYWLQVKNHESYLTQADSNRYKTIPIPARRGRIFDRNGKLLVDSRYTYHIVLERKLGEREIMPSQFPEIQKLLTDNLDIEPEWLAKRFEAAKYAPRHIPIVVKEDALSREVQWVAAHQSDYPELRVERAPQRHYLHTTLAAHALGYVGEVTLAQLNNPSSQYSQEKGYKFGDIVGQSGLERYYNEVLMGRDGWRKVIVNSRGRIEDEVDSAEPIPGRDLYTTLDFDLQQEAEKQGDTMPAGRGAIGMMDPNNGEILVFMSRPAFNPNTFSQRAKTPEGREEISEYYQDTDRPLYNRMIQGGFVPGSTWKLLTSVAALNEGVITPKDSRIQDGGIQLGNYFMNSMSHAGMPDVVTAITISADGYYYRLGLKMGEERFARWVEKFGFGNRTGIDLPHEDSGLPPTAATKRKIYEAISKRKVKEAETAPTPEAKRRLLYQAEQILRDAKWTDYDMAASAFGQGQNKSTPVQLMRYVSGLANGGKMYTPHLLLKAVAGTDRNDVFQPEMRYEEKGGLTVPMSPEIHDIVKRGMYGAVNGPGGTGGGARIEGFDVCGKTGTAQVASNERAGSKNKDHAWFISFAPRDKPEICGVVLTENAGFGGRESAPRAKAIYDVYYRRKLNVPNDAQAQLTKTP